MTVPPARNWLVSTSTTHLYELEIADDQQVDEAT